MSSRFHNKFHRHNHHSEPTDRNGLYPDSAYDPIASFEAPFKGEFYSEGNIITTQNLSADAKAHGSTVSINTSSTNKRLNVNGTVYCSNNLFSGNLQYPNDKVANGGLNLVVTGALKMVINGTTSYIPLYEDVLPTPTPTVTPSPTPTVTPTPAASPSPTPTITPTVTPTPTLTPTVTPTVTPSPTPPPEPGLYSLFIEVDTDLT